MDYIRINGQQSAVSGQCMVAESVEISGQRSAVSSQGLVAEHVEALTAHSSQLTAKDVKELLKDWLKLYPNSFAPDVEFKIYQLADGDIIIQLHEDLSSMAVSLLVLYFETISCKDTESQSLKELDAELVEAPTANSQQPIAYITIDDTEILLKQNEGKRAMVFCGQRTTDNGQQTSSTTQKLRNSATQQLNSQQSTAVRFLLEDNYVLDYNFEKRPQPVKNCDMVFEEPEFSLPEEYESVIVGEVVKKKIDEVLEEGLTPTKLLTYFLCGAIGLSIGSLIVYFMSK